MRSRRLSLLLTAALLAVGTTNIVHSEDKPQEKKGKKAKQAKKSVYRFNAKDIDGNAVALRKYRDQVLLVVNVASR